MPQGRGYENLAPLWHDSYHRHGVPLERLR